MELSPLCLLHTKPSSVKGPSSPLGRWYSSGMKYTRYSGATPAVQCTSLKILDQGPNLAAVKRGAIP